MKVVVASKNPAKINAAAAVLQNLSTSIQLSGVETPSGVSEQPRSDEETLSGAVNRAETALRQTGADLAIGLEGGVQEQGGVLYLCNWGALASHDGPVITAGGARIPLPEEIARRVQAGEELGPVMDNYANEAGIRRHKGAVGVLTAGLVNRESMFEHVVRLLIGQYQFRSEAVATRVNEH
ncbi:DUF84 family protein [Planococcus lenghuensis]|uniref:Probable inosine/xanthosine triphosphatase n=1 Tax=Planococcus lenghuensis TaxID=2213202 RepID=A0A1Q2KXB8_9BACL|nr:DUF84 family protein [Planococcus lenghuensis]AQQ52776.1 inosine/xanthosine triphosphatase [Planococcus lenghuensis]